MDHINQNKIKILILGLISLLFLIIDWVLIREALYHDQDLLFWIWPVLSMAISCIFLTFFSMLNRHKLYAAILAVAILVSYVYVFPKDIFVFIGGIVFVLLLFWFEARIRAEEKYRQDFSIRRITAASLNPLIYAFLLLISMNIYYNTSADFKANPESFYDALGRSAARSAKYFSGGETGINFNQSISEYLETEAQKRVPNYEDIPDIQKQQILEEARKQLAEQFNVDVSISQSLSELVANFAVDKVRTVAERFSALFPLIFTIIILALMRTFAFVFRWIVVGLTWVTFKILLTFKFFRLVKVPVEVETLEI